MTKPTKPTRPRTKVVKAWAGKRVRIKALWFGGGMEGRALTEPVLIGGQKWIGVKWDAEEDPDWHKASGIELFKGGRNVSR